MQNCSKVKLSEVGSTICMLKIIVGEKYLFKTADPVYILTSTQPIGLEPKQFCCNEIPIHLYLYDFVSTISTSESALMDKTYNVTPTTTAGPENSRCYGKALEKG